MSRTVAFRSAVFLIVIALSLLSLRVFPALAQSGRGRQPAAPPPKPTPRPATPGAPSGATTVLNVPEGGRLLRQDINSRTSRYVLRNGLTILISERHSVPLAAATVFVKAGSLSESDDRTGLASLTLNWLMRSADLTGQMAKLGARFSSELDYDNAAVRMIAPAESLESGLKLIAGVLSNPSFPAPEFSKAAFDSMRASRRFQDRADELATDRLLATAFTVHSLRRGRYPVSPASSTLTREQVVAFYQANYLPQNTVISLSGDIFPAQLIGKLQLALGGWGKPLQTPPVQSPVSAEEPLQDKIRYSNARADLGSSLVTIGYRAPAPSPADAPALQMLSAVLALGRGSRLAQVLSDGSRLTEPDRNKGEFAGLITKIESDYRWFPQASLLTIQLRVDPARIDRAEAEYFREIERFKREVISQGELERARFLLEKRYYDSISQVEDEAEVLARYQALLGDYRLYEGWQHKAAAVTAKDIQLAAAKILGGHNMTVNEYEDRSAQPRTFTPEAFAETMTIFAPTMFQPVKPDEVKPSPVLRAFKQGSERSGTIEGRNVIISEAPVPIKDFSILRGPRAYVREDRSQPLVSVAVLFQGGRLVEDQTTSGMTELMLRTMLKSTQTRKSDLIALESESYGMEFRIVNEPDYFGFIVEGLSRNADAGAKLLLDIIENPYFDKAELLRERPILVADLNWAANEPRKRSEELLWASLYPGHPYGLPRYGLSAPIGGATEEKLDAWHSATIKKQFPVVIVVGDTDGSALVSRIFSEGFKRDELDKALKVALPTLTEQPQTMTEIRGRNETAQAVALRSPASSAPETTALTLLAEAGRMRLANELIAKQAIADEVGMIYDARLVSGAFGAVAVSAPDQDAKSLELMRGELARLASSPPVGDEFEGARNSAIGSFAIGLQRHSSRAMEYAQNVFVGRKVSEVDTQPDIIRAIRQAELKRVADAFVKLTMAGYGAVRGKAQ